MHPFLNIFGFQLPTYGLMMALALISAISFSYFRTKKAGLDPDKLLNVAIFAIGIGMAGAYLFYIFVTYSPREIFASIADGSFRVFKDGGLVFYGGFIVGALTAYIACRVQKLKFSEYAAVVIPSIPLAHALGRVGCFFAGCCYGRVMQSAISVVYTNPIGGAPVGVPVFPIQLVEAFLNIVIFVILLIYTHKRLRSGTGFFLYLAMYAVVRFSLEYFRADEVRGIFLGLSTSQWISIAMLIFGVLGFIILRRKEKAAASA
ncbi:MAG: prolipoprotein diacylglyceryl transferase [Christensenellaceae bacterium]|nr:prolipoprotein diacylglyceryl transferase [Christensenellaceae bacterium]